MSTLRFFRNSNLTICASILVFIVSCTQYDINNASRSFDYSIYDSYVKNPSDFHFNNDFSNDFARSSIGDHNYDVLQDINKEYGTDVVLPDDFLDMYLDMPSNEIQTKSLQNGYVSLQDLTLVNSFYNNLKKDGFNSAINDFENDVIALNLPNADFERYNTYANSMKILNDEIDLDHYVSKDLFACLLSLASYTIAVINLWQCEVPALCIRPLLGYVFASVAVAINCSDD